MSYFITSTFRQVCRKEANKIPKTKELIQISMYRDEDLATPSIIFPVRYSYITTWVSNFIQLLNYKMAQNVPNRVPAHSLSSWIRT